MSPAFNTSVRQSQSHCVGLSDYLRFSIKVNLIIHSSNLLLTDLTKDKIGNINLEKIVAKAIIKILNTSGSE